MANLAGFEYDIFISSRHNDNLDGWVTVLLHPEKELREILKSMLSSHVPDPARLRIPTMVTLSPKFLIIRI